MLPNTSNPLFGLVISAALAGWSAHVAADEISMRHSTDVADAAASIQTANRSSQVSAAYRALAENAQLGIAEMIELTQIPAPPFAEQRRAERFAEMLDAAGIRDVQIDAVGNVIGRRAGQVGGRTVALVAHIDTVFPAETDVTVRQESDTYYAPGIGDNSRGLVLLLALARAMNAADINTRDDVLFIGSVGEEGLGDLRGVRYLFGDGRTAWPIDAMIAIDGGAQHRIVTSAVGSNRYRVTIRGPGGHSYGGFGRAHPHQALGEAITLFTRAATKITEAPGDKATFSVGRIGGGTSINSIPFESWFEVDMRSVDPQRLELLDDALRGALEQAIGRENTRRQTGAALTMDIVSVGNRPAGRGDAGQPLIQRAIAAQREHGIISELSASSTDANIPISMGIPAITISRGGISRNAHALNESWQDIDTLTGEKIALLLVVAEAGLMP
ncbi:MAG: M20/M25/M40 family metallo-hydrolase [Pseudomonadota bacterium]